MVRGVKWYLVVRGEKIISTWEARIDDPAPSLSDCEWGDVDVLQIGSGDPPVVRA